MTRHATPTQRTVQDNAEFASNLAGAISKTLNKCYLWFTFQLLQHQTKEKWVFKFKIFLQRDEQNKSMCRISRWVSSHSADFVQLASRAGFAKQLDDQHDQLRPVSVEWVECSHFFRVTLGVKAQVAQ